MVNTRAESVVAAEISRWPSPLEEALFGTMDPSEIVRMVDSFCSRAVGGRLDAVTVYRRGVGGVFGMTLADGRRIVVKVHRPELIGDALDGVREVQRHLADVSLPAPRPLGDPSPLGRGLAAAEELLDRGRAPSAHDPGVRRGLATELHRFVDAAGPLVGEVTLPLAHPYGLPSGDLWPPAHDLRFDLRLHGGEWIDEVAATARAALREPAGQIVVGHADWRVENLRFDDGLTGIFDWDSVALLPEPALVGANATGFTADFSDEGVDPYPSFDETAAFVADYEEARGASFTADESETLEAALLYRLAYGARCEYSDAMLGVFSDLDPDHGWRALLRTHARKDG